MASEVPPAGNGLMMRTMAGDVWARAETGAKIPAAMSERLVRLGVSMAQFHIMVTLQRNGLMPMSRLADLLGVSQSNASGLIDRLEERGYVERTRVAEDRRVVLL